MQFCGAFSVWTFLNVLLLSLSFCYLFFRLCTFRVYVQMSFSLCLLIMHNNNSRERKSLKAVWRLSVNECQNFAKICMVFVFFSVFFPSLSRFLMVPISENSCSVVCLCGYSCFYLVFFYFSWYFMMADDASVSRVILVHVLWRIFVCKTSSKWLCSDVGNVSMCVYVHFVCTQWIK